MTWELASPKLCDLRGVGATAFSKPNIGHNATNLGKTRAGRLTACECEEQGGAISEASYHRDN
jgi:hypothetical protein